MRLTSFLLALGLTFTLSLGCNKAKQQDSSLVSSLSDTDNESQESQVKKEHPGITVANKILAAIHAGDAAAVKPLLNATNRKKVSDSDLAGLLQEAKEQVGQVKESPELRQGRDENEVMAKIRVVGDEVFVIVLSLEDGKYLLEDINSPSVADYQSKPVIE